MGKRSSGAGTPDGRAELEALRRRTSELNRRILDLLSERARVVIEVRKVKERHAIDLFSPGREAEMLEDLVSANPGPFPDDTIRHLFREVFRASLGLMEGEAETSLRVARKPGEPDAVIRVGGQGLPARAIGAAPVVIAGPCAVEDEEQVEAVAAELARLGVGFIRGGAFKPRTSPYAFQGLGARGLGILAAAARRHGLATVTEVVDTRSVDLVARHADVVQVGSRNMANYELLKALGSTRKPVLLKRGFAATLDELLLAAEYLASAGNEDVILCERGVRTFARETRFTLDISAVPLLKRMTRLPVVVDVSHSAGRRDILPSLARAALAAGAHGVMVEVHPDPALARSDAQQQLDFAAFRELLASLAPLWTPAPRGRRGR
ncbi:MAG: bifunctional 3-deoxy-7-phosphoheptulonate synthase/chorismate mutase [Deltaproteobacteria bacterium]|nr:bifunctional 3-deoxy-7-phosphoheptulonate synthase/chorismate mutase [Deltaproteobacteria bacterium]